MAGTTPNLALPYPDLADSADVPRDVKALADRLDLVIPRTVVTSLPGSPSDGDEIYYLADATNGVIWHFRYRAAASGSYKWELLGGSSLVAEVATQNSVASGGAWVAPATPGPSITVPLGGDYLLSYSANCLPPAVANGNVGFAPSIGGAAPAVTDMVSTQQQAVGAQESATGAREVRKNGIAASAAVELRYQANPSGTAAVRWRMLSLRPIRVG